MVKALRGISLNAMLLGSIAPESLTQGFDVGFGHRDGPVYTEQMKLATGRVPVHMGDETCIHQEGTMTMEKEGIAGKHLLDILESISDSLLHQFLVLEIPYAEVVGD